MRICTSKFFEIRASFFHLKREREIVAGHAIPASVSPHRRPAFSATSWRGYIERKGLIATSTESRQTRSLNQAWWRSPAASRTMKDWW
jgi:hypothetical protein